MENSNNNPLNFIVKTFEYIVDVFARVLVGLFDGTKQAIDHANPSLFALVATILPFVLPLPVAFMTSHSAQKFFGWESWSANVLGFGLEGLGLLAWVKFVDAILEVINSTNKKVSLTVILYGVVALTYEGLLLTINAVLASLDGAQTDYVIILGLICVLPALSATVYGHHKQTVEKQLATEQQERRDLQERIRQERRADRKEAAQFRQQYAADTKGEKLPPFRGKRA